MILSVPRLTGMATRSASRRPVLAEVGAGRELRRTGRGEVTMQRGARFIILTVVALVAASLACGGGSDDPNSLQAALVDQLSSRTVRGVQVSDGDLLINTRLDRTDLDTFYSQIGAIHGVVVAHDPDVRRVILDDTTGQRIIIPMEAMRRFSKKSITFDEFRDTWAVINPDEGAAPAKTPGRPKPALAAATAGPAR